MMNPKTMVTTTNRCFRVTLGAVIMLELLIAAPVFARILKSIGKSLEAREQTFTLGTGLDYQRDEEESEYDFELILEYGITDNLKVAVVPNYIHLARKEGKDVSGFGELETSVSYDFLEADDGKPGMATLALIKLPTASNNSLGTGETDLTFGLSVNQNFEQADADFSVLYTFVGSPPGVDLQNSIEFILAGEWYASETVSLIGELTALDGAGRSHSQSGGSQGLISRESRSERSITLGITEQIGESMKLEQGIVYALDGTLLAAIAWEWTLGDK